MEPSTIIQACKNNQPWAQNALFEQFTPVMLAVCRRYVGNRHDAEEVMLTGFLQFFQKIHQFDYKGDGSISAYLKKIMINQSLMHLRKKQPIIEQEPEESIVQHGQDALDRLSAAEIMELITRLPTGYRVVFNLYVIEGMTHQQIADVLHIKTGTSKSQLSKARNQLQEMIIKMENHGIQS